jgi:hypothetical protein
MMRHPFPLLAGVMALFAVTACGTDRDATATIRSMQTSASALVGGLKTPTSPAPPARVTRDVLNTITSPVDLVLVEKAGVQGVIGKLGTSGDVETWASIDNLTLSMRDGMILATRGFAGDLMSAQVPRLSQVMKPGQPYTRRYGVLSGDDQIMMQQFDCQTARVGAETITIVDLRFATQRITETCVGPTGAHKNDFWVETGGKLRRSRQWIGESIGFVVVEHLR